MRKQTLKLVSLLCVALAAAFLLPLRAAADDEDPPSRVARLSHTDGPVSFQPAGTDDWLDAVVNRPMTTGDKLWADSGARAELHLGSASLRIGSTTGFNFLNLTDSITQIQVTEGSLRIRVKRLDENETFEIDTPNLAFSILRPGTYRINVNEAGDTTVVSVRGGQGEVTGGGQAFTVDSEQTATFTGTDQLNADVEDYAGDDDFDQWCNERDHHEDHSASVRYVSPEVVGYEDLDDNGGWRPVPEYGTVWFPHTTTVGWAPYHYGHWVYIAPWGYTWVEDEPWGYAPFHYGRWVTVGGVWGWVPAPAPVAGVVYVRPVYAPALVAWVGGPGFGVGVGAVSVGWFPLGPREVYVPSYPVSRTYVNNINVTNTRVETTVVNNYYTNVVVNKNVNVTNVTYVNQRVSGAVTATNGAAFTGGQSVSRNIVKVDARTVASAPVSAGAPAITPTRQAVLGTGAAARVHPPAAFANRAVVAKTAPPPPPPTFEKQAAAIRANGGRPLAVAQTRQLQPVATQAAARPNFKMAPAATAKLITPHPTVVAKPGVPPNGNKPPVAATTNKPGNAPVAAHADNRPPAARPPVTNTVNPAIEQKHQEQLDALRKEQDLERQKVEQQQLKEKQKTTEVKQPQVQQKQQQQLEDLEKKHDTQQQQLESKQAVEKGKPAPAEKAKPKGDRPPQH
jgi:hypothetical protein